MNYTKKYHLPQWKETDRVLMEDFNQMCTDIESGIESAKAEAKTSSQALSERITAAQNAADAAQTSAGNAQAAAENAQAAAGNAQTAADAAMEKANNAYSSDQKPYVVGSYVGTGGVVTINTGFRPSFVIISGQTIETTSPAVFLATGDVNNAQIGFRDKYFSVYPAENYLPHIDLVGRTYHYIAFR